LARSARYKCLVCGRPFPEGQGIKMRIAGEELYFHSNRCLARFFKSLVGYVDESCIRGAIRETISEYNKLLEDRIKSRAKVI